MPLLAFAASLYNFSTLVPFGTYLGIIELIARIEVSIGCPVSYDKKRYGFLIVIKI
jgi:hypothetical protein